MTRWVVLLALAMTSPVAAKTSTAVLVMQQAGPSAATDLKVRDHLVTLGFAVRLADRGADSASARDMNLVVISSSVSGKDVNPGWRALAGFTNLSPVGIRLFDAAIDRAIAGK